MTDTGGTPAPPHQHRDLGGLALVILAFAWILTVALTAGFGGWFGGEIVFVESGDPVPGWVWFLAAVGIWLLLSAPLAPLGWFWRGPRYRAVFQTWAIAAAYVLILAPAQLPGYTSAQWTALLRIALHVVFIAAMLVLIAVRRPAGAGQRRRNPEPERRLRPTTGGLRFALLIVPALVAGWLLWGALGSPLDTLLNLAVGLSMGAAAALMLAHFLLRPLRRTTNGAGWDITLAGFVAGAALLIMSIGLSLKGIQIQLMLALPALGWLLAAVSLIGRDEHPEHNWPGMAALVGFVAAFAMMFVDPDELALVLNFGTRDALSWANRAASLALVVAWLLGLVLFGVRKRIVGWQPGGRTAIAAAGAWITGALLLFIVSTPGFHGERLFVILREQADLSTAAHATDFDARRQQVYETLVDHADGTQAGLRAALDRSRIGYTPYYLVNAVEVRGGPLVRAWLASRPEVGRVINSPVLRPLPASAPVSTGSADAPALPDWNLTSIGADRVWNELGVRGAGVVVGQSDSGVQWDHPELRSSYRGGDGDHDFDWLDPWAGTTEPVDLGGHGTHTLGSVLGDNVGIAPDATWFACANLRRNLANPALYLDCMQFMLAPYPVGGDPFADGDPSRSAHVLNNSWGCPPIEGCDPGALVDGVRALRAAGIFVVASAGNEGPSCESVSDPIAIYDAVFSVGAIDESGALADFSSVGPVTVDESGRTKPDIVAPGVEVYSAFPGSTYEYSSGTSMAGPHVAGVVALMWSANPGLVGDVERTETILQETARPFQRALPDCPGARATPSTAVGYGIVDAYAAVQRALAVR